MRTVPSTVYRTGVISRTVSSTATKTTSADSTSSPIRCIHSLRYSARPELEFITQVTLLIMDRVFLSAANGIKSNGNLYII